MPTTIDTAATLLSEVKQHQLLDSQQLTDLKTGHFPDARGLAQHLVKQGWITPFQMNHLLQSRARELVIGPYVLLERLGEGATGQVFKGRHRRMQRLAAVKVIRPELLTQPDAVARFYREVQATSRLSHPNIVEAYDAGPVGRTHFFAMEFLEGTDLDRLVKRNGPLPIREACDYVRQAALGLKHAHDHGLVHRDIKPSNLMRMKGVIKVLDLGLVHMSRETAATLAATLTENGTMLGTPDFMAPEQADNTHSIDSRADIYSLGATLYFLLTAKVPFPNCSLMQKLLKLQTVEPTPIEKLRPELPAALVKLIRVMMAKRPQDRLASTSDVIAGLEGKPNSMSLNGTTTIKNLKLPERLAPKTDPSMSWSDLILVPPRNAARSAGGWALRKSWSLLKRPKVAASVTGILLLSALYLYFFGGSGQDGADWRRIAELAKATDRDADAIHQELVGFRMRHPASRLNQKAAELAMELPSPLDKLGPGQIPAEEQVPGLPRDVVAVLGKHRLAMTTTTRMVAFSPADLLVASLGGPTGTVLQLWHLPTGEMRATWNLPAQPNAVAIAPGGKQAATVGVDQVIRLWDVTGGKERATLEGHGKNVTHLAFSANGSLLASGGVDNSVKLWDLAASKEKATLATSAMVRGLIFSPDNATLATIGMDRVIRLWDLATAQQRGTITLPATLFIAAFAFSPDGKQLGLSSPDFSVRLHSAANGQEQAVLKGHTQMVHQIAFSADGQRVATASYDRGVRLWNAAGKQEASFAGHPQTPMMMLAFRGQNLLMATQDQTVWEWDAASRRPPEVIRGHPEFRTAALPAPDGRAIATGGRSGLVCFWDPSNREIRTSFHAHPTAIAALAYSPDGKQLVSAGHETSAKLWDAATGKSLATLASHEHNVSAVAFSLDGKLLASADQAIKLFDAAGNERLTLKGHAATVTELAFAPDAPALLSASDDGTIRSWDTGSGSLRQTLKVASGRVVDMALSHNGQLLATAGEAESGVRLWTGSGGHFSPTSAVSGAGTAPIRALAFSPDTALLAVADQDGRIVLWKLAGSQKQQEWLLPSGPVQRLAFAMDGRHLLATSGGGTVYLLRRGQ